MNSCTEITSSAAEILVSGTAQTVGWGVAGWAAAFETAWVGCIEVVSDGTVETTCIISSIGWTGKARPITKYTITAIKIISLITNHTGTTTSANLTARNGNLATWADSAIYKESTCTLIACWYVAEQTIGIYVGTSQTRTAVEIVSYITW
jgi:hypothetical protein